jgi:hypothetical protein
MVEISIGQIFIHMYKIYIQICMFHIIYVGKGD